MVFQPAQYGDCWWWQLCQALLSWECRRWSSPWPQHHLTSFLVQPLQCTAIRISDLKKFWRSTKVKHIRVLKRMESMTAPSHHILSQLTCPMNNSSKPFTQLLVVTNMNNESIAVVDFLPPSHLSLLTLGFQSVITMPQLSLQTAGPSQAFYSTE